MKAKKLLLGLCISLFILSCDKENESTSPMTSADAKISAEIDQITDDVSLIVEEQSFEQESAGRNGATLESMLPSCATVTTTSTGNSWTRTIDFGTEGCEMPNGNFLKGIIIISGSNDMNAQTQTISYSFVEFYHNNKLIEGNRTLVRTIQSTTANPTPHPVATINVDMTVTYPDGGIYYRTGNRVREMIAGFTTPMIWQDNVFSITGSWTTSRPNGMTHTATIIEPLSRINCPRIVSGTIEIVGNNNTAILDYGDGACDNLATVTINGQTTTITLGN